MATRLVKRRGALQVLKRAVAREGNAEAMLVLLQRSVTLGHKKLALLRCLQAERMGITVTADVFDYCRLVAAELPLQELAALMTRATREPAPRVGL